MKRVARAGGMVGFYVWDYPGGGMEFMRAFWNAATVLDPHARDLTEDRRFPFCTRDGLVALATRAGLQPVESAANEAPPVLQASEASWRPFSTEERRVGQGRAST